MKKDPIVNTWSDYRSRADDVSQIVVQANGHYTETVLIQSTGYHHTETGVWRRQSAHVYFFTPLMVNGQSGQYPERRADCVAEAANPVLNFNKEEQSFWRADRVAKQEAPRFAEIAKLEPENQLAHSLSGGGYSDTKHGWWVVYNEQVGDFSVNYFPGSTVQEGSIKRQVLAYFAAHGVPRPTKKFTYHVVGGHH